MAFGTMVAFWGTSFLLVITPGPDWAFMVTAGLRNRSVLPATAGLLAGYLVLTAVVAAGVAVLVADSPVLLSTLTLLGAAYLMWLGVTGILHPAEPSEATDDDGATSPWRHVVEGAGVSGLNPKALLLFVALLPQFTESSSTWPVSVQIVSLGLVHISSCAIVYSGVGLGARLVLGTRPSLARTVSRLSGAAMCAIGLLLIAHRGTI